MNVVADTSVLQYLFQLEVLSVLPGLFGEVAVPAAVVGELATGRQRGWAVPDPDAYAWMRVRDVDPNSRPAVAARLGEGEQDALALALELPDALLLLDDDGARQCACALGIQCAGTLGVLLRAKEAGMLAAIMPFVDRLQTLGFRLHPTLRARVLVLAGE